MVGLRRARAGSGGLRQAQASLGSGGLRRAQAGLGSGGLGRAACCLLRAACYVPGVMKARAPSSSKTIACSLGASTATKSRAAGPRAERTRSRQRTW